MTNGLSRLIKGVAEVHQKLTRSFETKDATAEQTAAVERAAHGMSHDVKKLLIRVVFDGVMAAAKSMGPCI